MENFTNLQLCEYFSENVDVHVSVSYSSGVLTFTGQDLGPLVEEVWGDLDYEYWYTLDKEAADQLISVIHGEGDLKAALQENFSGTEGLSRLKKLCDQHGIRYRFFSYA